MNIPFVDLKNSYLEMEEEINDAVLRCLHSGAYVLGPFVEKFEQEFAAFCGCKYGIGVNSGTSALHLALLAAGVGPGDEVLTTPLTFTATGAAIMYTGATPVFVDIDPGTLNIDPSRLGRSITNKTKAIIVVHLYGCPAEMDAHGTGARVSEGSGTWVALVFTQQKISAPVARAVSW